MLRRRRYSQPTEAADQTLDSLLTDHSEAIFRVAMSVVHDRHLAEDIVQETVMKAWQAFDSWTGQGSLRSWVLSIAHNTAVSYLRSTRDMAQAPNDFEDGPSNEDIERQSAARSDLDRLRVALMNLDELSRSIVVMRDIEAMSYQHIADSLGVPVPTVKTRLLRSRRELQRVINSDEASEANEQGVRNDV